MKLNLDCVRNILLIVEEKPFNVVYTINNLTEKMEYTEIDIKYCCHQLYQAGYLDIMEQNTPHTLSMPNILYIYDLTFQGHEFLNNIKSNTIWNKTKAKSKELGISSLKWIGEFAQQLAIAIITKELNN